MAHVPDFPSPKRGGGDHLTPDVPTGPSGSSRGKYPADSGGPPQTKVGQGGPSGNPYEITAQPTPVDRPAPAKSPKFVASRDI